MGVVGASWALWAGPGTETGYLLQPHWNFPQLLPTLGLGFWLVRGSVWGQLCGPGQRGSDVCLLKEEQQHEVY